jgi:hypothetical protein
VPSLHSHAGDDIENIAVQLRTADELRQLANHYDPSIGELAAWRRSFDTTPPMRSDFERLVTSRLYAEANKKVRNEFSDAVSAFLRQSRSPAEVSDWLRGLDPIEIACIVDGLKSAAWILPAAVVVRSGVDRGADAFAPRLSSLLKSEANRTNRRALIRFFDPLSASAALDAQPDVRRIIGVERLRDILQFGPLAQITDPSSGLGNTELVGRTTFAIINLIATHLEMLSAGADLRSCLTPGGNQNRGSRRSSCSRKRRAP